MAAQAVMSTFRTRDEELDRYINLKLAALGLPVSRSTAGADFLEIAGPLLRNYHQKDQQLGNWLCPADRRIQDFLDVYLGDVCPGAAASGANSAAARLPANAFVLDREGMARILSLPVHSDTFASPYLNSYRLPQGVLHNPKSDKRTTQGLFHVAEGGLPVPADKAEVSKQAFAALWSAALRPPADVLTLPFTTDQDPPARCFVSLLLRPLVCPATGTDPEKTMEIRFLVPGSLVSNLDFVESIFGNGGDPYLPENDAGLDVLHWTGHTGCVVLAPHLVGIRKTALGLPHVSEATERQRRDGMCWTDEAEPYNEGRAFKATCRDASGVMVTIIADNYYGYCKKEVKTQISFAANLYGLSEEEHAGGALAFATYVLGQDFFADRTVSLKKAAFADAAELLGDSIVVQPEGYAVDRRFPNIYYRAGGRRLPYSRGLCSVAAPGQPGSPYTARRRRLRSAQRLPHPAAEATGGHGMAPGGFTAPRHVRPQTLHGVWRREIRDLKIHGRCPVKGPGLRARLSDRYGPGGGGPGEGLFRHLSRTPCG